MKANGRLFIDPADMPTVQMRQHLAHVILAWRGSRPGGSEPTQDAGRRRIEPAGAGLALRATSRLVLSTQAGKERPKCQDGALAGGSPPGESLSAFRRTWSTAEAAAWLEVSLE
jgi:hypothetical protein